MKAVAPHTFYKFHNLCNVDRVHEPHDMCAYYEDLEDDKHDEPYLMLFMILYVFAVFVICHSHYKLHALRRDYENYDDYEHVIDYERYPYCRDYGAYIRCDFIIYHNLI